MKRDKSQGQRKIRPAIYRSLCMMLAIIMLAGFFAPGYAAEKDGAKAAEKYGSWKIVGKKWCYYDANGVCKKEISKNTKKKWVSADGKKFYFTDKKKPIDKGFRIIKGKLYYIGPDKALVTGKFTVKGETYKTTKDGNITGLPYYKHRYKTFVLVDISDQKLQYYKNKKLVMEAPVVTGNISRGWDTPTGVFKVRYKCRRTYLSGTYYVDYWIAFISNEYGMHDASWRKSADFKNPKAYKTRGSHGCINMRKKDVAKLYGKLKCGTKVIVRK